MLRSITIQYDRNAIHYDRRLTAWKYQYMTTSSFVIASFQHSKGASSTMLPIMTTALSLPEMDSLMGEIGKEMLISMNNLADVAILMLM